MVHARNTEARYEEINGGPRECEYYMSRGNGISLSTWPLGRTIDTRAKGIAILEHVRKMHAQVREHALRYVRARSNERQIDSHGCVRIKVLSRRNCLIASPARKWKLRGSMREVSRTPRVSCIAWGSISRYDGR